VLDRSILSTWVYQGEVGGVDLAFLEAMTKQVMGQVLPDRILLLDLDADCARERREQRASPEADAFEGRGDAFLDHIVAGYRKMAERHKELVRVVDASGNQQAVHEACLSALDDLLDER